MGSPLVALLANFFIGHYEKLWLNNCIVPKVDQGTILSQIRR